MKLGKNVFEIEKEFAAEVQNCFSICYTDPKSLEAVFLKLVEEVGEVAEVININLGNLPMKTAPREPVEQELADVFNCLLCVLHKSYPNDSTYELMNRFLKAMVLKNTKYRTLLQVKTPEKITVNTKHTGRQPPEPWYFT